MKYKHTNRPGFLLGFIDFFTAGLFFLLYMPLGGLQDELEKILGHKVQPYWKAYLLGVPTLFIYTLVWMARIAEELKAKAIELGIPGPYTSWRHMFWWNLLGCPCCGPAHVLVEPARLPVLRPDDRDEALFRYAEQGRDGPE